MNTTPAIACSLETGDFRECVGWIASINERFLRGHGQASTSLLLRYDREALPYIVEMVRRERTCCAFLDFELTETSDHVELAIRIPEHAQGSANALFAPLLENAPSDAAIPRCASADCGGCENPVASERSSTAASSGGMPRLSSAIAVGALACGVCCALPFMLPAVALGSAGGLLAWFGSAKVAVTGVAILMVIAVWLWVWRRSAQRKVMSQR
jgi:hypothetical protein